MNAAKILMPQADRAGKETGMAGICVVGSYIKTFVITADRIPREGETLMGRNYRGEYGGKGADMAVQARRLGAEVDFVGVVGEDELGAESRVLFASEGIGTEGLRSSGEQPTSVGLIIKDTGGKNIIVIDSGANGLLSRADVDRCREILARSDVVLTQLEVPPETTMYAMETARALGKLTILNPAPAIDLRGYDLSSVDILTPNETEARICAGLPADADLEDAEIARRLLDTGARNVIITLGEKGSAIFTKESCTRIDPCVVDTVDSNGAGDSYNAALAVALAGGSSLEESARYASVVSALCCTRWECVPSYHTAQEVEAFLEKRRP